MNGRRLKVKKTLNIFKIFKTVLAVVLVYAIAPSLFGYVCPKRISNHKKKPVNVTEQRLHNEIVKKYFEQRKDWVTSPVGTALFKNKPLKATSQIRIYTILIWKYWNWIKLRHLTNRTDQIYLDDCSVKNCIVYDDIEISSADAVVVHIQHGLYPKVKTRDPNQVWVFLSDESPYNALSMAHPKPTYAELANVFNWSMTYRSDSDVPVPYGRTVPLPKALNETTDLIPFWGSKNKKALAAALISNCGVTRRMNYINELQKFIKVDIYGKCSKTRKKSCPGSFRADCPLINGYYFYLAFENSECRQYFTEKIFYNAYSKGAIPVIMGPPLSDCKKLLPPSSYIHVDNFASPIELAAEIVDISNNRKKLLTFHKWRQHFQVVNEHGYFGTKSYHLCRLCEALNHNPTYPRKMYSADDLKMFLDPKLLCRESDDHL